MNSYTKGILQANKHLGLIDQIKAYRSATGAGLKESKEAVEAFRDAQAPDPVQVIIDDPFAPHRSPFYNPFKRTPMTRKPSKHWFICVLDKVTQAPQPASTPRLYTSAEQARKVAREMAEKNRGESFVVYEGTDVIVAPPVSLPETLTEKLV